ncbi:MAG: PilN domain-containing protein [bacterium]|nr:PilN domain-containing protein [bacterium]
MINLLPPQDKYALAQELRLRAVGVLFGVIGLCALLFLGFLAIVRISLSEQIHSYEALADSFAQDFAKESELASIVKETNRQLISVVGFYESQSFVTSVLDHISYALPSDMNVTHVTYEAPQERRLGKQVVQDPGKITIRGFAPTRALLVEFTERMNSDPFFQNVSFPPSNWASSVNVQFSMSSDLAP